EGQAERGPSGPLFSNVFRRSATSGADRCDDDLLRLDDLPALHALGADLGAAGRAIDHHADGLQVRKPAPLAAVVRVTDMVASHRSLAAHGADARHGSCSSVEVSTDPIERY